MNDTHPEAEAVLIGLIRQATVAERLQRIWNTSHTITGISRRAIQAANPNLTAGDVGMKIVEHQYGRNLARDLKAYLAERTPCPTANF